MPVSNILLYSQLLEEGLDRLWDEMESQKAEVSEMREELAVIQEQARELEFLDGRAGEAVTVGAGHYSCPDKKAAFSLPAPKYQTAVPDKGGTKGLDFPCGGHRRLGGV